MAAAPELLTPNPPIQTKTTQTPTTNLQANTHGDSQQTRLKAVTDPSIKNPLSFTDPTDRQAATLARMQHIMASPRYQKLDDKNKAHLRSRYYDKYVAPGYTQQGFSAPDKTTWINAVTKSGFKPEDYYQSKSTTQAFNMLAGAEAASGSVLKGTLNAGVWLGKKASLAQLGLKHYFDNSDYEEVAADKASLEHSVKTAQKVVDRISHDTIQDSNFWLQTHPSKTMVERADSFIGENLIQMPLYEAIGSARGAMATKNLSKALLNSSSGAKIAAHGLMGAADAFVGSVMQGQSKTETASNMMMFMGMSSAGEGIGVAGRALMKKFAANVIAHGGRPLAEAASSEAMHELENNMIHGHKAPEGVELKPEHVMTAVSNAVKDDPVKAKVTAAYKVLVNSISVSNYGKSFKDLSKAEKAKVRTFHAKLTAEAVREMPVHIPETAKMNSVAAVKESQELDPEMAKWDQEMAAKHKINFVETLHSAEQEAVKKQTGIKSNQAVVKKVAKNIGKKDAMKPASKHYKAAVQLADAMEKQLDEMYDEGGEENTDLIDKDHPAYEHLNYLMGRIEESKKANKPLSGAMQEHLQEIMDDNPDIRDKILKARAKRIE